MTIYKQRKDHIYVSVMSVWGGGLYAYKPQNLKCILRYLKSLNWKGWRKETHIKIEASMEWHPPLPPPICEKVTSDNMLYPSIYIQGLWDFFVCCRN